MERRLVLLRVVCERVVRCCHFAGAGCRPRLLGLVAEVLGALLLLTIKEAGFVSDWLVMVLVRLLVAVVDLKSSIVVLLMVGEVAASVAVVVSLVPLLLRLVLSTPGLMILRWSTVEVQIASLVKAFVSVPAVVAACLVIVVARVMIDASLVPVLVPGVVVAMVILTTPVVVVAATVVVVRQVGLKTI